MTRPFLNADANFTDEPASTANSLRTLYRTALLLDGGSGILHADQIHRIAMGLFPMDLPRKSPRQSAGILSRHDGEVLIVQSHIAPTRPVREATIVETGLCAIPDLSAAISVRVKLAAESNTSGGPTFIPKEARQRLERTPIPSNRRHDWAIAKLASVGLLFQSPPETQTGGLRFAKGARPEIPTVDVVGTALVTDQDRLTQALIEGVGRAKSYGCGLLDIRPPSN